MTYRNLPLTLHYDTIDNARLMLEKLLDHYEATAEGATWEAAEYDKFIIGTTTETLATLRAAIEAERPNLRRAWETEIIGHERERVARVQKTGAGDAGNWLLEHVMRGFGYALRANQGAIEASGPVRDLADQLVQQGLMIQGDPVPESALGMIYFHVTKAGAAAIGKDYVQPGSDHPRAKPHVRQNRPRRKTA